MFIQIHQETLGHEYYIAFSCTYLDKVIENNTGMSKQQENKNLLQKR
jgi:hypothetical protein